MGNQPDVIARAQRFNEDARVIAVNDPTLVHDLVAEITELRFNLYIAQTTSHNLGSQLADIAESIGMPRDSEDLAITPRVLRFVADAQARSESPLAVPSTTAT